MPQLIDTNVLIAASAHVTGSALSSSASPLDPTLRKLVFSYLSGFAESDDQIVIDIENHIRSEYEDNLGYDSTLRDQDYGILLLQELEQSSRVNYVTIEIDSANAYAKLDSDLDAIVSDKADKKWIAAAVSHRILYDNVTPPVVYAAESDWFFIETPLREQGFHFERLLPESWYLTRHQS